MRQLALLSIAVLVASTAIGQVRISTDETDDVMAEVDTVAHSELAMMALRLMAGDTDNVPEPSVCFSILLNMGLIPSDWVGDEMLTHGELSIFLERLGAKSIYVLHKQKPPEPDEPASRDYTEAMLRRALLDVHQYTYIHTYRERGPRCPISRSRF